MNGIRSCWMALALTLIVSGTANAQLAPPFWEDSVDPAPFAPADLSEYGHGPQLNEGYFFSYEGMFWTIDKPQITAIGRNGLTALVADGNGFRISQNTVDTGFMTAEWTAGSRLELGKMCDRRGFLFSTFQTGTQNQALYKSDVDVVFVDPPFGPNGIGHLDGFVNRSTIDTVDDDLDGDLLFGRFFDGDFDGIVDPTNIADQLEPEFYDFDDLARLPVVFTEMTAKTKTSMWSAEAMAVLQSLPYHHGGVLEAMFGVRYAQIDDDFFVSARGGILDQSKWDTEADNRLVGPQAGIRYINRRGPWFFVAESRFFAAYNFQQIRQWGQLGSELTPTAQITPGPTVTTNRPANTPFAFSPTNFRHSFSTEEFAPMSELRLMLEFQVTRAISARVGWTGLYVTGIARSTNLVDYTLPTMGILESENQQDFFAQSVTAGITINRP